MSHQFLFDALRTHLPWRLHHRPVELVHGYCDEDDDCYDVSTAVSRMRLHADSRGVSDSAHDDWSLARAPDLLSDPVMGHADAKPFQPANIKSKVRAFNSSDSLSRVPDSAEWARWKAGDGLLSSVPGLDLGHVHAHEETTSTQVEEPPHESAGANGSDSANVALAGDSASGAFSASVIERLLLDVSDSDSDSSGSDTEEESDNDSASQSSSGSSGMGTDSSSPDGRIADPSLDYAEFSEKIAQSGQEESSSANIDAVDTIDLGLSQSKFKAISGSSSSRSNLHDKKYGAIQDNKFIGDLQSVIPEPAKRFPFELDLWQKQAIFRVENGQYVFVTAHTSAGKTVVAEYAIASCLKNRTKCIYTSPIKSLSNQKYRDFHELCNGDVGVITGDLQLNPSANCLIVTTETLRSMLYKGANVIRDVQWVVFDEAHYVTDEERGVVWEEVIIMLPEHANIILLSATAPNAFEFADWVGRIRKRKVYLMGSEKRPVPLEHFAFVGGKIVKLLDKDGRFTAAKAKRISEDLPDKDKAGGARRNLPTAQQVNKLVHELNAQQLLPVIFFSFSKKMCEKLVEGMHKQDWTTAVEKRKIHSFVSKSIATLGEQDRQLPQLLRLREMLKRGIALHHAGLLPIAKEIVELLFQQGYVRVLVATETFAMGVNMPARTVVFSSMRKNDGREFREIQAGEYAQMAGRAGRRGLDDTGVVIVGLWNGHLDELSLRAMMKGTAKRLDSKFRLTYVMILNLMRLHHLGVKDMLKRSFSEAHKGIVESSLKASLVEIEDCIPSLQEIDCMVGRADAAPSTLAAIHEFFSSREALIDSIGVSKFASSLSAGSLVYVCPHRLSTSCLQAVVGSAEARADGKNICFEAKLLMKHSQSFFHSGESDKRLEQNFSQAKLIEVDHEMGFCLIRILDPCLIVQVTKAKTAMALKNLGYVTKESIATAGHVAFGRDFPPKMKGAAADPSQCYAVLKNLSGLDNMQLMSNVKRSWTSALASPCSGCPMQLQHMKLANRRMELEQSRASIKAQLSDSTLSLLPEFQSRLNVLRRLNMVDVEGIVVTAGRVAAEMNTADEILAAEMITRNVLQDLPPEQCVALLSAMVCQEKDDSVDLQAMPPTLIQAFETTCDIAEAIQKIESSERVPTGKDSFRQELNPSLIPLVYHWALQEPLVEAMQYTELLEGSVVRTMMRLHELVRSFKGAFKTIGSFEMSVKMERGIELIKRDVIFAASLWTMPALGISKRRYGGTILSGSGEESDSDEGSVDEADVVGTEMDTVVEECDDVVISDEEVETT